MMIIKIRNLSIISLSLMVLGCYTVIKHPQILDNHISEREHLSNQINYVDACSQCHSNVRQLNFIGNNSFHPDGNINSYNWKYYHDSPWWIDERHYISRAGENENQLLAPTQKRDFQHRDSAPPEYPTSTSGGTSQPSHLSKEAAESQNQQPPQPSTETKRTSERRDTETVKKKKTPTESDKNQK